MPAHIYARVGRWEDAAGANTRVIGADGAFRKANPRPGFYAMYMAHNQHFLGYALMMQGRSAEALKAAREMIAGIPQDFLTEYAPVADGYPAFAPFWKCPIGSDDGGNPATNPNLPSLHAAWRVPYGGSPGRISLTAMGREEAAAKERIAFISAADAVPADRTFGNNPAKQILDIAAKVLDGDIAAARKQFPESSGCCRLQPKRKMPSAMMSRRTGSSRSGTRWAPC